VVLVKPLQPFVYALKNKELPSMLGSNERLTIVYKRVNEKASILYHSKQNKMHNTAFVKQNLTLNIPNRTQEILENARTLKISAADPDQIS
jgi:hypothetical protein